MTLVEFLEARLAEDELTAKAAVDGAADWHAPYTYRDVKDGEGHYVVLADSRYPQSPKPHTSLGTARPGSCASARRAARSSPTSFISMRSVTSRAEAPRRGL